MRKKEGAERASLCPIAEEDNDPSDITAHRKGRKPNEHCSPPSGIHGKKSAITRRATPNSKRRSIPMHPAKIGALHVKRSTLHKRMDEEKRRGTEG